MAEQTTIETTEHTADDHHSDTVILPVIGTEITVYGGIYTVVFGVLGVLTVLEVIIAEILKGNESAATLKVLMLLSIGLAKAALVVLYYMHLKDDSRIFALVLLMPLFITLLSSLYLLFVPTQGYALP